MTKLKRLLFKNPENWLKAIKAIIVRPFQALSENREDVLAVVTLIGAALIAWLIIFVASVLLILHPILFIIGIIVITVVAYIARVKNSIDEEEEIYRTNKHVAE